MSIERAVTNPPRLTRSRKEKGQCPEETEEGARCKAGRGLVPIDDVSGAELQPKPRQWRQRLGANMATVDDLLWHQSGIAIEA